MTNTLANNNSYYLPLAAFWSQWPNQSVVSFLLFFPYTFPNYLSLTHLFLSFLGKHLLNYFFLRLNRLICGTL